MACIHALSASESDTNRAHDGDEHCQADCAPERTDECSAISPLDFHETDAAPQIIALQTVKKVF